MRNQHTPIIPINQIFYNKKRNEIIDWEIDTNNSLDLEAITSFCSLGFMLDDDTFFKEIKVIPPSTKLTLDKNTILNKEKIWEWHYTPKKRSFKDTLDELQILLSKVKK